MIIKFNYISKIIERKEKKIIPSVGDGCAFRVAANVWKVSMACRVQIPAESIVFDFLKINRSPR